MYRERALLKFRRYYLHGIRDGKSADESATDAMWKARNELLEEVKADPAYQTDAAREDLWSDVLIQLMVLRMMLSEIPIDINELKRRSIQTNQERERIAQSASAEVADLVNKGLEAVAETNKEAK